jgi:hypothetical protein
VLAGDGTRRHVPARPPHARPRTATTRCHGRGASPEEREADDAQAAQRNDERKAEALAKRDAKLARRAARAKAGAA